MKSQLEVEHKHRASVGDAPAGDGSASNPAGSARRRLMKAVGGSSAAVIAGLIVSGWKAPIVRSTVLPAHAQATGIDGTPGTTGCLVAMSALFAPGSSIDYSVALILSDGGSSLLVSTEGVSVNALTVSGTAFVPAPADVTFGAVVSGIGGSYTANATVSCCDDTATRSGLTGGTEFIPMFAAELDEGGCVVDVLT